jgi:hypothetical protein
VLIDLVQLLAPAHEVVHALDHAAGTFGLLGNAFQRLAQHARRAGVGLVQQVQRAGGVAG